MFTTCPAKMAERLLSRRFSKWLSPASRATEVLRTALSELFPAQSNHWSARKEKVRARPVAPHAAPSCLLATLPDICSAAPKAANTTIARDRKALDVWLAHDKLRSGQQAQPAEPVESCARTRRPNL